MTQQSGLSYLIKFEKVAVMLFASKNPKEKMLISHSLEISALGILIPLPLYHMLADLVVLSLFGTFQYFLVWRFSKTDMHRQLSCMLLSLTLFGPLPIYMPHVWMLSSYNSFNCCKTYIFLLMKITR
jgi:hypothetical protein